MNFYYYSNEALDYVKSLRKSGNATQSDIDVANKQATLTDAIGTRVDAIQLYVFPLGKDKLLGSVVVDDTKPIHENIVEVTSLPVNVAWVLRDTVEYLTEKKRFSEGAKEDNATEVHMNNWIKKHGHAGRGIAELQKALKKYTTNFVRRPNLKINPIVEIYPYVGYVRVNKTTLKTF